MFKKIIPAVFLIMASVTLYGQNNEDIEGTIKERLDKGLLTVTPGEIIDYNISNNTRDGFSAHKYNYLLPFTYSGVDEADGRDKYEIKYQFSIKQRLLKFYGWAIYLAYSQKSFWQAYDLNNSRPFRENNFNPEIFMRTKMWSGVRIDSGFEHESNGRDLPYSRSWNRIYFTPYFENDYLVASLKGWYRVPEKNKKDQYDVKGDDNPDIHKYYGYGEFCFTLKFRKLNNAYLSSMSRFNPVYRRGAEEITLTVPLHLNTMSFMVQYWEGYGESLIDYNVRDRKIGLGLNFTR